MENDERRLVAWGREMTRVHAQLRAALAAARDAATSADSNAAARRELLLVCHGFCVALTEHHQGEDTQLFPAIAAAHPDLGDTLHRLTQDHAMIGTLITRLESAPENSIATHLDGIAAIMESHFRYEEKTLLGVLDALSLDADPRTVFGPL